jgi:hypothetical protein
MKRIDKPRESIDYRDVGAHRGYGYHFLCQAATLVNRREYLRVLADERLASDRKHADNVGEHHPVQCIGGKRLRIACRPRYRLSFEYCLDGRSVIPIDLHDRLRHTDLCQ